jgi:hypothetical protein
MAALWTAAAFAWNALLADAATGWSGSLAATVFGLGVILYALCAIANYLALAFQRARALETRELQALVAARTPSCACCATRSIPTSCSTA